MSTEETKETAIKTEDGPTVKKLNGSTMQPPGERVGIYTIAILSAIGILLIVYSGIMALANSGSSSNRNGMSADDIHDIIDDLDLEDPTSTGDTKPEVTEPTTATESEPETTVPEIDGTPGVIIENNTNILREAAGSRVLGELQRDDEVTILDMTSNPFWILIYVDGIEGWVDSNRVTVSD